MTSLQEQRCTAQPPVGPGTRMCPVTSLQEQRCTAQPPVGPGTRTCPVTSCQPALAGRRSASPFSVVLRRQPSWGHPAAEFYFAVGPGLTSCQPALAGRRSASPFSASAPERIRTSGLSLRRRPLYPAELRGRGPVSRSARRSTAPSGPSGLPRMAVLGHLRSRPSRQDARNTKCTEATPRGKALLCQV